eukprot:6459857-Amphidinium_carterae.1
MVKGFAATPVLSQDVPQGVEPEHVKELIEAGWRRVALEDGSLAWFHESDGVLSLVCPCIMDVAETGVFPSEVADADVACVDSGVQTPTGGELFHDCVKRVQFREPEVEQMVQYQVKSTVKSITVRTADRARALRARRHPGLDVYAELAAVDGDSDPLGHSEVSFGDAKLPGFNLDGTDGVFGIADRAHAFIAEASLRQLPEKVEEMPLSKMVLVELAAVRSTCGDERQKWHAALKKEYDNLVHQGTFDVVTAGDLSDKQRSAMVPGRVVLTLKPIDTTGGERGAKRKARIVLCGNFVPDYSSSSTKNLDVAAFRCFLNIVARKQWLLGTLDVPAAFLHADLPDREVFLSPPKLLSEFGVIASGECWKLKKALYGLKEAPRLWQSRRDADLAELRFKVCARGMESEEVALWRSRVHDSVWIAVPSRFLPELHGWLIVLGLVCVYVDDLAIGACRSTIESLSVALDIVYKTGSPKVLGEGNNEIVYLGMQIELVRSGKNQDGQLCYEELLFHQTRYLEELIDNYPDLFHGGRDSPADPDSFGKPIEKKDVDPQTLKKLQCVG